MINILLVDDHSIIAEGVKLMLSKVKDINVVSWVSNGEKAVNYLKKTNEIDVVLMDINMPVMNGIEATKIIKNNNKKINIVALTMHEGEEYVLSMLRAGAIGYITKESGTDELVRAIRSASKGEKYYSDEISKLIINALLGENRDGPKELSRRELEMLSYIAGGYTNVEISKILFISKNTVDAHRRNILDKLNLKNTVALVKYAIENSLEIKNEPT